MSGQASYQQAVAELESLEIFPTSLPSLDPIRRALDRSGLERIDPRRNVIIAGTNGKGTTAATLSRLLASTGKRVGLYTSPHLVTTRERVRIQDADISEEVFSSAYADLRRIIQEERLTHFEALTLLAAAIFHSGKWGPPVDWGIWEVGLGGLYDATNAMPHHFCAITQLGLDHQNILGETLEEIAVQKFGVIGEGAPVVYSPMEPRLAPMRREVAKKTGCTWIPAQPVELLGLNQICTSWGSAKVALPGKRAAENTATALTLFESVGFEPSKYLTALSGVRWPGRFSPVPLPGFACPVYVSGDHNLPGVESLIQVLSHFDWKTLHLIVGVGRDKAAESMLRRLVELPRMRLHLTETTFKPLGLENYPDWCRQLAVSRERSVDRSLEIVRAGARPGDLVVVTGSLYLVGAVLGTQRLNGLSS